ncbi:MAG: N-acetylglucosamine-6-phosphate deacetylase [Rhodobacteraceae bacterium]|nr:N-acetylglucosamine-6-phosphate deacetylase [Paracoccaceae bacterium]
MTSRGKAYSGARIHDGRRLVSGHSVLLSKDEGCRIVPDAEVPSAYEVVTLQEGVITPGFVDLQVNGGGGVLFNDAPSVDALRAIANAHQGLGTAAFLPTLITDSPTTTRAAIDAIEAAVAERVPGIIGLHLEGPHLSVARKGAHDGALIRSMTDDDMALLIDAIERLPNLMVTVAPESVTLDQMRRLSDAGVILSLGHTDADRATCHAAFDAGVRCVTHLFNAMSQFGSREPGLVGATLEREDIYAGLIADAVHVHPASIRIALAAKPRSDRVFLVTDAMAPAGSDIDRFVLSGRDVFRKDGRLMLADGTLAGADLDMATALDVMVGQVGDSLEQAVTRATATPTAFLRERQGVGVIDASTRWVNYLPPTGQMGAVRTQLLNE